MFFVSCVSHAFASVHCCLDVTSWERVDLLALVGYVYSIFVTFQCGILGQVWYLIVSFPDFCRLRYFNKTKDCSVHLQCMLFCSAVYVFLYISKKLSLPRALRTFSIYFTFLVYTECKLLDTHLSNDDNGRHMHYTKTVVIKQTIHICTLIAIT